VSAEEWGGWFGSNIFTIILVCFLAWKFFGWLFRKLGSRIELE